MLIFIKLLIKLIKSKIKNYEIIKKHILRKPYYINCNEL